MQNEKQCYAIVTRNGPVSNKKLTLNTVKYSEIPASKCLKFEYTQ